MVYSLFGGRAQPLVPLCCRNPDTGAKMVVLLTLSVLNHVWQVWHPTGAAVVNVMLFECLVAWHFPITGNMSTLFSSRDVGKVCPDSLKLDSSGCCSDASVNANTRANSLQFAWHG